MNEQPELLTLGVVLRDEDHRMFVYLGEFKGQRMAAPLFRRDKQALAGDVPLTEGVVARVSAIAPVTRATPTGQIVDETQLAACMQALERLADTESLIARHVPNETDGTLFSRSSYQKSSAGGGSTQGAARKPESGKDED